MPSSQPVPCDPDALAVAHRQWTVWEARRAARLSAAAPTDDVAANVAADRRALAFALRVVADAAAQVAVWYNEPEIAAAARLVILHALDVERGAA